MKKLSYFLVAALAFTTTGCSDFLDLTPPSDANEGTFYKTKKDMESAMVGVYSTLYDIWDPEGLPSFYGELMSDNAYNTNTAGNSADYDALDKHSNLVTTNTLVEEWWETYYKAIFRINTVISKGANVAGAEQLVGEAKFMRAFYYFDMVRAWGDVPLITKPVTTAEAYTYARAPKDQVYAQIIQDLKDASAVLPAKSAERFKGAATSDAANVLLGKVYLTMGNKEEAKTWLLKEYGKFSLEGDYSKLWGISNKNCKESIFEIQFAETSSSSQPYSQYWAMFTPLDNRIVTAWGAGENQVTDDLWNAFEAGDPRRDATIADGYHTSKGDFVPTRYCVKWKDSEAKVDKLRELARNNFIVLRYADVLLMLTEATGDAKYLNEVRHRVGLPGYGEAGYPTQYNTITLALQHEYQVEFGMEFQRWFVLQRLGTAAEVMKNCGKHVNTPIYLLPIPQKVVDQNPSVIKQNEFYVK